MIGKIKRALGIEGVKVNLDVAEKQNRSNPTIEGSVKFTTQSDNKVRSFTIKFTEKYSRGRGKHKLIDEYVLGKYESTEGFTIKKEEIIEIPFTLKYKWLDSEMDRIQNGNFFTSGIIMLAKRLKGVKSTYTVTIEADVVGTKLDPFDKVDILF